MIKLLPKRYRGNMCVSCCHVQLCNSIDCCPLGSSVHGILQARILEWVVMPSSKGNHSLLQSIFPNQGSNSGLPHCRWILSGKPMFLIHPPKKPYRREQSKHMTKKNNNYTKKKSLAFDYRGMAGSFFLWQGNSCSISPILCGALTGACCRGLALCHPVI